MLFLRPFAIGLVASLASAASPQCPTCDGMIYTASSGATFIVECGMDRAGGDLFMRTVRTFAGCMDLCSSTTGCVDVSYAGTSCYLKNQMVTGKVNSVVWGARLASAALPGTGTGTATISSSTAAATGISLTCPTFNGLNYTSGGRNFTVECGKDRAGGDLSMLYANSLASCIDACTTTTGCLAVSYVKGSPLGPCYLKNSVKGSVTNGRVWGATFASAIPVGAPGCGLGLPSTLTAGGTSQVFMLATADGRTREYRIWIPATYDANRATPLLLSLHGNNGASFNQEAISQFSVGSINPNMIAVYPQGDGSHWQGAPYSTPGVDDVAFIDQLITKLSTMYCIDSNRIYASGQSNGGGMVGVLACDTKLSKRIAAFAANSGAFYAHNSPDNCVPTAVRVPCTPGRAHLPFLEVHGVVDETIPYYGGVHNNECMSAILTYMEQWANMTGYNGTNTTTSLTKGNLLYEWGTSASGRRVLSHVSIPTLGHDWPYNFNDFNSSTYFMSFFNNWTLDTAF